MSFFFFCLGPIWHQIQFKSKINDAGGRRVKVAAQAIVLIVSNLFIAQRQGIDTFDIIIPTNKHMVLQNQPATAKRPQLTKFTKSMNGLMSQPHSRIL